MDYTDEQFAMMERMDKGVLAYDLPESEQEIVFFLDDQGLAQPRVQIADGYYELNQNGKRVLAEHRQNVRAAKVKVQQEIDRLHEQELLRQENERKEKAKIEEDNKKEQERLNWELSCKEAERKAEHKFQYKLTFLNAFLTFVSGFASGAILTNLDQIIPWIVSLFE